MASTPTIAADGFGGLEAVHFGIIAVLVVLTIIGIVYGMKLARRRREGTRELEDAGHLERTGDMPVAAVDPVPAARESIEPVAPVPVAPAPAEPVAAAVVPAPAPPPFADRLSAPAAPEAGTTDLTLLKGLGPKVAAMLVDLGVPDIAALARLSDGEADAIAGQLGVFAPRMGRDRWLEQARLLAAGDKAGFEAKFGKL